MLQNIYPNQKNKTERYENTFGFWFAVVFVLIVIDQITKWYAQENLASLFLNNQFAFSIPLSVPIMYALYTIVLSVVIHYLYKNWKQISIIAQLGWSCILAGGLSNIGERIVLGHVRDFIPLFNGVFNLADVFIIAGVILVLFSNRHSETLT